MKTLKITLVAIFSLALLTAVLPSSETQPIVETQNHEVKKPIVKLTAMNDLKKKRTNPTHG